MVYQPPFNAMRFANRELEYFSLLLLLSPSLVLVFFVLLQCLRLSLFVSFYRKLTAVTIEECESTVRCLIIPKCHSFFSKSDLDTLAKKRKKKRKNVSNI